MSTIIANKMDEKACLEFLTKYGKGELTNSILKYINDDSDDLFTKYDNWLEWKNKNNINFGGEKKHINSSYGSKTFHIYEWGEVDSWSEIFEYIYLANQD